MVGCMQFGMGLFDVSSDMINGKNYADGQYGTSIYFVAGVRTDFDGQYGPHLIFSALTLALVWLPGTFRTVEMARETEWSNLTAWESTGKALFLLVVTLAWPALIPLL